MITDSSPYQNLLDEQLPSVSLSINSSEKCVCVCVCVCRCPYVVWSRQWGDRGGWRVLLRAGDGHGGVGALGRHWVPLLLLRHHTASTQHAAGLLLRHGLLGRWNYRGANERLRMDGSSTAHTKIKKWIGFIYYINCRLIYSLVF